MPTSNQHGAGRGRAAGKGGRPRISQPGPFALVTAGPLKGLREERKAAQPPAHPVTAPVPLSGNPTALSASQSGGRLLLRIRISAALAGAADSRRGALLPTPPPPPRSRLSSLMVYSTRAGLTPSGQSHCK